MWAALLPILSTVIGKVVDKALPDEAAKDRIKSEALTELMDYAQEIEAAAASIVKQEAASSHWLAANWRPITMLIFVALIVARWMGWAAPNLSEAEYIKLWEIVELGLGGYVIGRTVEKAYPMFGELLKRK